MTKLTDEKRAEIARLRSSGLTKAEVAARTGVSTQSVRRATLDLSCLPGPEVGSPVSSDPSGPLVALEPPKKRTAEREAARRGMLGEAAPVICEGGSLPFVGSLAILPALVAKIGDLRLATHNRALGRGRLGLRPRSTRWRSQAVRLLRPTQPRAVCGVLLAPRRAEGRGPHPSRSDGDRPVARARPCPRSVTPAFSHGRARQRAQK